MNYRTQKLYDFLGISSGTLCLVHCLLVPVLSILPISFFDSVWIDLLFCCLGMFAVSKVVLYSNSKTVKIILLSSISFVMLSVMLEIALGIHFEGILLGGIGLVLGHYINYKKHKHS